MRSLIIACRRAAGSPRFLLVVCALWTLAHLWRIDEGPGGFHEWREADTCSVAWNLHTESFDLMRPRIAARGDGTGVTGQELPLMNAVIAVGWSLFGEDQHWWARLLAIASGVAIICGTRRLLLDLRWPAAACGLAAAALACSPLLFFYGRKIIPDMPGAAFALWGALLARRSLAGTAGWRSAAAGAFLLALAGMIKPTALCIGLPLAWTLFAHHGWRGFFQPRWWLFGVACLAPMVLWFRHAKVLAEQSALAGDSYFTITVPWRASLDALLAGQPLGKLLVEWPWQLWIGLPLVPVFVAGCLTLPRPAGWAWAWLGGAFLVLLPFAGQFGPHDYYTLTMAAPCAVLTGAGLAWALRQRRRSIAAVALVLLAAAGPLAVLRVAGRYGGSYDHRAVRAAVAASIPPGALIVAYDSVPPALFYRIGRNGWWMSGREGLAKLPSLVARGARFIAARGDRRADLAGRFGPAVISVDGLDVYALPVP